MAEIIGGKPLKSYKEFNVNATINQLVESFPITQATSATLYFMIECTTENKLRSGKLKLSHIDSANPEYIVNEVLGDSIPHEFSVLLVGSTIEVYFKNDDIHTVLVKISKSSF